MNLHNLPKNSYIDENEFRTVNHQTNNLNNNDIYNDNSYTEYTVAEFSHEYQNLNNDVSAYQNLKKINLFELITYPLKRLINEIKQNEFFCGFLSAVILFTLISLFYDIFMSYIYSY